MLFDYKSPPQPSPKGREEEVELYKSKYLVSHYEKVSYLENDLMRVPTPEEFFFLQSDEFFGSDQILSKDAA